MSGRDASGGQRGGLEALQDEVRAFVRERDWEQFHTPRNLLLALAGEVGELAELFQWRTDAESDTASLDEQTRAAVEDELADVFICLLRLSDVLDVDLLDEPVDRLSRGPGRPHALAQQLDDPLR